MDLEFGCLFLGAKCQRLSTRGRGGERGNETSTGIYRGEGKSSGLFDHVILVPPVRKKLWSFIIGAIQRVYFTDALFSLFGKCLLARICQWKYPFFIFFGFGMLVNFLVNCRAERYLAVGGPLKFSSLEDVHFFFVARYTPRQIKLEYLVHKE